VVTPDPIKARIQPSGLAVELIDFCTPPPSSTGRPRAGLNFLYFAPDGTGRLYVNDTRGKIWRVDRNSGATTLFLDLRAVRGSALIGDGLQVGLRSFAFHPDYARAGRPGYRKLYTVSTETAASRPAATPTFSGECPTLFHDVLAEWSVDAANTRVLPGSRREVLRIVEWRRDHNADQLMFDPNATPGTANYGKLFVGVGDGGNWPSHPDPYEQAQDGRSLAGKILRIDPLQRGGKPFSIPPDNPFVGRADILPAIWAMGLRHPQNICFDLGGTRRMIFTDIGQAKIEEVNLGVRGANYGWPLREGTFVTARFDETTLYARGPNDAASGFTYPVAQYDHTEGRAITGGFVYRGSRVPSLRGQYLLGDMVNGRVFHVPVSHLKLGETAQLRELTLKRNGRTVTLRELVNGPNYRVDLRFGQDSAGEVYVLTKQDGKIRRLVPPS
jgi:glucose/arabinose dehydrogenase